MAKFENTERYAADCYLHEGPAIRLMEATKYRDFISRQRREVLGNCGAVNPEDMESYIASGGFKGLEKAVKELTPEKVVEQVKASGLRDRTAAGRFTGKTWEAYRRVEHLPRYVAATRVEGASEAWTERTLLEGNPFSLVEGMAIAGYALGADRGIIYIPAAYKPVAFRRLSRAVKEAQERGYIGPNVFRTPFSFHLEIRETAGGDTVKGHNPFVCGECARSLFDPEGSAGAGSFRELDNWPGPFYTNNVETYMNLPLLLRKGNAWFSSLGGKDAAGTKVFALTGNIHHPCLVEAPVGSTPADLLKIADGESGSLGELKAFQVGGARGGIFPESFRNTPLGLEAAEAGWKIGSGHIVLMDAQVCIVEMVRYSIQQAAGEGCDRCDPCARALKNLLSILNRLVKGFGETGDLQTLESIAGHIQSQALCEFGRSAANPVLTGLRFFRSEFEDHLKQRCPSKFCKDLNQGSERNLKLAA